VSISTAQEGRGAEDERECPLCAGPSVIAFTVGDRNRAVTDRLFTYRRCLECGSFFLADVPEDLGRYYPTEYYGLPSVEQLELLAAGEAPKLQLIESAQPPGRLVDIGAGFGLFARAAQTAGYDVTAIEMDARCCEYLETVVNVRTIPSDAPADAIAARPPSRVVTLWHVLEHLRDPWDVLAAVAANLEPGGVVAIAMPNPQAFQFRLLRRRWAHVDAPRHLFLIPARTLTARAAHLGLRRVRLTTDDPAGRGWNRFGWEYALRWFPARHRSTRVTVGLSMLLTALLRPLERRELNGAAYTAVFVKHAEDG
jgi:2-polyprenyl-3-methyl-5-hydroxy-6-metoxy-1,4-benzoquinol methylase